MEEQILIAEKKPSLGSKIASLFWEPSATFNALVKRVTWLDIVIPLLLGLLVTIVVVEKNHAAHD